MKKLMHDEVVLQTLRRTVDKFGFVLLDAKSFRELHGVGRSGVHVSAEMEEQLRGRGYWVKPLFNFGDRTQQDVILVCGAELPIDQLNRVSCDAQQLWIMPLDERGPFWWRRHGDKLVNCYPHLEPTMWFWRTLWPVSEDNQAGDEAGA